MVLEELEPLIRSYFVLAKLPTPHLPGSFPLLKEELGVLPINSMMRNIGSAGENLNQVLEEEELSWTTCCVKRERRNNIVANLVC